MSKMDTLGVVLEASESSTGGWLRMICQVDDTAGVQGSVEFGEGSGVSVDVGGEELLSSLPPRVSPRPRPRPKASARTTMTRGRTMRRSFRRSVHGWRGAGLASIVRKVCRFSQRCWGGKKKMGASRRLQVEVDDDSVRQHAQTSGHDDANRPSQQATGYAWREQCLLFDTFQIIRCRWRMVLACAQNQ